MSKHVNTRSRGGSPSDDIPPDFDFTGAFRGKHYARFAKYAQAMVTLDPDVAAMFPDPRRINDILRTAGNSMVKTKRRKAG